MNAMLQRLEDEMDETLARSTNKQGASSEHCGAGPGDGDKGKGKATGRHITRHYSIYKVWFWADRVGEEAS